MTETEKVYNYVLLDLPCRNEQCEKYMHWVYAEMAERGSVIKVVCPFCNHQYETVA